MSQMILHGLIWAFSFWMVADCLRRQKSPLWVVAILLIQPYGAFAYVAYLKWSERQRAQQGRLPTPEAVAYAAPRAAPSPRPSALDALPTLDVADQLEEQARFSEASHIYRRALDSAAGDPRALHGLARCLIELDREREALSTYEALMAIDPRYRNYAAALEYAEALHRVGRTLDAAGLLEGLAEETGRLNHRLALAHYYEASGQTARARDVLEDALEAYASSPEQARRANRRWHRRITDKLEQLVAS
ncbi:MAG TPA: tetratricopeptide repeat protein [Polyangiaceae bacterium]|nr:tetratricopeptide repeat protein [Polyangiaceae bacterium]